MFPLLGRRPVANDSYQWVRLLIPNMKIEDELTFVTIETAALADPRLVTVLERYDRPGH